MNQANARAAALIFILDIQRKAHELSVAQKAEQWADVLPLLRDIETSARMAHSNLVMAEMSEEPS